MCIYEYYTCVDTDGEIEEIVEDKTPSSSHLEYIVERKSCMKNQEGAIYVATYIRTIIII